MAVKEVKTAKLASRGRSTATRSAGTCACGGDLFWAKVYNPRGRMMRVCEKCGALLPKTA
jgi:hypothetical protein